MSGSHTYIARVRRDPETGRTATLEIAYDFDTVHLEEGDEFVTIQTKVPLEFGPEEEKKS